MGVETPDLQIYHVNEEGIYKMKNNSIETNTDNLKTPFSLSVTSFSLSAAAAVMTAGHREEREASEMNGG